MCLNLNCFQIILLILLGVWFLFLLFSKTVKQKLTVEYYMYTILVTLSTGFIVINWERSVNMQFFTAFNGYNIIFILWLVLLMLSIIKIDFNGIKSFNAGNIADKIIQNVNTPLDEAAIKREYEATLKAKQEEYAKEGDSNVR